MTTRNFCKRFNPRPAQFRALFRTAVPLIAVLLAVTGCPDPTDSPVDAAVPTITGQPAGAAYNPGDTPEALTVTASVTDGGTLSYQWYRNDTNDTETPESVGENTAAYTPSITSAGTAWYYVVVTNTNNAATGAKTASATSAIVSITVGVSGGGAYELTLTNIPRIVTGDAAVGLVPAPGTGTVTVAGTGTIADHTITVTLKNLDESFNPTTDWVKDDAGYQVVLMYGDGYGLTIYDRDAEAAPLPPNAAVSAAGFDGLVWKAPVMRWTAGKPDTP